MIKPTRRGEGWYKAFGNAKALDVPTPEVLLDGYRASLPDDVCQVHALVHAVDNILEDLLLPRRTLGTAE